MNKSSHTTGTFSSSIKVFIWGYPLEFSLSPFFQEHASFLKSEKFLYSIFRGEPREFRKMISDDTCRGANITVPNKITALKLCDDLTETARACGSVNTLFKKEERIIGDNTDGKGLYLWLSRKNCFKNATIGILGNGGTARSLAYYFQKKGLSVTIYGRNEKGWENKVGEFIHIDKWKDDILTINTLPFIKSGKNIIDISYHFGQISEDATGMLACQGWLAFKRWFKTDISLQEFIRITFLHKNALQNTIFIKKLCRKT